MDFATGVAIANFVRTLIKDVIESRQKKPVPKTAPHSPEYIQGQIMALQLQIAAAAALAVPAEQRDMIKNAAKTMAAMEPAATAPDTYERGVVDASTTYSKFLIGMLAMDSHGRAPPSGQGGSDADPPEAR